MMFRSRIISVIASLIFSLVILVSQFGVVYGQSPIPPGTPVFTFPPSTGGPALQIAPLNTATTIDIPAQTRKAVEETKKNIERTRFGTLALSVTTALHNAVSFFAQKLAYDTAVWVASGGEGQSPLVNPFGGSEYAKRTREQAAGEAIGSASQAAGLGNLLCEPSAQIKLGLILPSIRALYRPPVPKCDFKNVLENWEKFGQSMSNWELLRNIGLQFDPDKSELGAYLTVADQTIGSASTAESGGALDWMRGTFKPFTDPITKRVKTPSEIIEERTNASLQRGDKVTDSQLAGSYLQGILYPEFFLGPASVFANTLASSLMQRLMSQGFISLADLAGLDEELIKEVPRPGEEPRGDGRAGRGRPGAQLAYADLLTPRIIRDQTIDLLSEFTACPPKLARAPNNCILDGGFAAAVRGADSGKPMTVRQALKEGFLHGDWVLVPLELEPRYRINNSPCYENRAYCFSDLRRLRKARVLPIGWEMAAGLNSELKTLNQITQAFHEGSSKFFRLIDSQWLLTIPAAQCHARVFSEELEAPDSGRRAEQCVDLRSCLEQDNQGNCIGEWGYCLREKNTWRFPANATACPAEFESCRILERKSDRQKFSYLLATVDTGQCTKEIAGCRWYERGEENGERRYFRRSVAKCSETAAGCTETKLLPRVNVPPVGPTEVLDAAKRAELAGEARVTTAVFNGSRSLSLKVAPPELGCYDTDGVIGNGTTWPRNVADAVSLNTRLGATQANEGNALRKCSSYAGVCAPTEAGCEAYTGREGGEVVSAVLEGGNSCPQACVGYRTWIQEPTYFEPNVPVIKTVPPYPRPGLPGEANFIASKARSCPIEAVGCDEFTNLDKLASGGEAREFYSYLRACVKPTDARADTFYTWEGSDTSGFQLKSWSLAKAADGKPLLSTAVGIDKLCDATIAKIPPSDPRYLELDAADCREFLDRNGTISYARWSRTIVVTDDCHPYRKTAGSDPTKDQQNCSVRGGQWRAPNPAVAGGVGVCFFDPNATGFVGGTPGFDSRSCSAPQVGCRRFAASRTSQRLLFFDTFEDRVPGEWGPGTVARTAEGEEVGNQSISLRDGMHRRLSGVTKDKKYVLTLRVKAAGPATPNLSVTIEGGVRGVGQQVRLGAGQTVATSWTTLTFEGAYPLTPTGNEQLSFTLLPDDSVFVDHIVFTEEAVDGRVNVIRGSWSTPRACDLTNDGALQIGAQLRCGEYTTRRENLETSGRSVFVKSFTRACRLEAVGCRAVIDTKNSTSRDVQMFNTANTDLTDDVTIPKDEIAWLVLSSDKQCRNEERGCSLFSQPTKVVTDATGTSQVTERKDVMLQDFPDAYSAPATVRQGASPYGPLLCEAQFAGCELFSHRLRSQGGDVEEEYVFRDPEFTAKRCLLDATRGWVIEGSELPCPGRVNEKTLAQSVPLNQSGLDYQGYAGVCPAQENRCTAFVDPQDTAGSASGRAKSYTYLDDHTLGEGDCAGKVDLNQGCVLFRDTGLSAAPMPRNEHPEDPAAGTPLRKSLGRGEGLANSQKTYERWEAPLAAGQDPEPIVPIDCADNPDTTEVENPCNLPEGAVRNDTNRILKVTRSRSCGQWLACSSSWTNIDEQPPVELCTQLGVCTSWENTVAGGRCSRWLPTGSDQRRNLAINGSFEEGIAGQVPVGWSVVNANELVAVKSSDAPIDGRGTVTLNKKNARLLSRAEPALENPSPYHHLALQSTSLNGINGQTFTVSVYIRSEIMGPQAWIMLQRAGGNWESNASSLTTAGPTWTRLSVTHTFSADPGQPSVAYVRIGVADVLTVRKISFDALQIEEGAGPPSDYGIATLNRLRYVSRNVTWSGLAQGGGDYDGYSIPEQLIANRLQIINMSTPDAPPEYRLGFVGGSCPRHGTVCGFDGRGTCANGRCVYGLEGGSLTSLSASACRGFPRADSPFPRSVLVNDRDPKEGFDNAKICENGDQCLCSYNAVDYGSLQRFFPFEPSRNDYPGFCQSDSTQSCTSDDQCPRSSCVRPEKKHPFRGWPGFCLERDERRPINGLDPSNDPSGGACLTWLPLDVTPGDIDLHTQAITAAFVSPADSSPWYCVGRLEDSIAIQMKIGRTRYPFGVQANFLPGAVISDSDLFNSSLSTFPRDTFEGDYQSGSVRSSVEELQGVEREIRFEGDSNYVQSLLSSLTSDQIQQVDVIANGGRPFVLSANRGIFSGWVGGWSKIVFRERQPGRFSFGVGLTPIQTLDIENITIVLKPQPLCNRFAFVGGSNYIVAATNRVNNLLRDFDAGGAPVEGNTSANQCQPWGGLHSETFLFRPNIWPFFPVTQSTSVGQCVPYQGALYQTMSSFSTLFPRISSTTPLIVGGVGICPAETPQRRDELGSDSLNGGACAGSNVTALAPAERSPQIFAPDHTRCRPDTRTCRIAGGGRGQIAINGLTSNNVTSPERGMLWATLTFYTWADHDHMPITNLLVDFGDGNKANEGIDGSFKNLKPYCSQAGTAIRTCNDNNAETMADHNTPCTDADDCQAINRDWQCREVAVAAFGNTPEACNQNFAKFTHAYTWSDSSAVRCDGAGGKPRIEEDGRFAACYKPRVIVRDNWGWCNGGIHDSNPENRLASCLNNPSAGTPYSGWIVVLPP